jgi:hypothetical protein
LVLFDYLEDDDLRKQIRDMNLEILDFWDLLEQGKTLNAPK